MPPRSRSRPRTFVRLPLLALLAALLVVAATLLFSGCARQTVGARTPEATGTR